MEAGAQNSGPGGVGGTSSSMIPEVRGTRGSLPEGTSQPDDPGGVGGFGPEGRPAVLFFGIFCKTDTFAANKYNGINKFGFHL